MLLACNSVVITSCSSLFQTIFVKGECQGESCVPYSTLLEQPSETVSLPSTPASPNDVSAVLFSSGTTGLPKATEITHLGFKTCAYTAG